MTEKSRPKRPLKAITMASVPHVTDDYTDHVLHIGVIDADGQAWVTSDQGFTWDTLETADPPGFGGG